MVAEQESVERDSSRYIRNQRQGAFVPCLWFLLPHDDRLSKTGNGQATGTYGYQAGTHWLTSIGSEARRYDNAGNTTGNSAAGETWGYGYDGKNRMTVVQRDGSTVAMYTYNAFGERVAKAVTLPQTINERFVYNEASQLIAELGSTNKDYIWLDALPVAVVDSTDTASTIHYVTADGFNTPRAVSDASGAIVWNWPINGNPFGEQSPSSSTGYVYNQRFPGQYFDIESGLNYNVQRYYESVLGRFTQVDPISFAGAQASLYGYGDNNPLSNVDPLGLNTYTIGANGALAFLGGGQGALGIYFNPGKGCGEELDFGLYSSAGVAVGTNVGAGVVGGVLYGPASSLAGRTYDTNSSIGPVQGSFSVAPDGTTSWTAGWSIVGLPGGGSVSATTTQTFGISDLKSMVWRALNQAAAIGAAQHPQP